MAYDAARGEVVLFGGYGEGPNGGGVEYNETWIWDGSSWTDRTPAISPPLRVNTAMAYDAARGQVVLFGGRGSNSSFLNDTWVWDGTTWTQMTPASSPPPLAFHSLAYDGARGQVVLLGGYDGRYYNDTWVWDGTNWTRQFPANSPPARIIHAMAFDAARSQVVLFGGVDNNSFFNDTWLWNGTNWTQVASANAPTPRGYPVMVYDEAGQQVVLFGGNDGASYLADTWVWDGTDWSVTSPLTAPTPREYPAMAYDSARRRAVLFGGASENGILRGDTWVWPGQSSVQLPVSIAPAGAVTFTCPSGYTNIGAEMYRGQYPDTSTPVTRAFGPGSVCSAVGAIGYTMEGGYLNGTRTTDDGDYWVRISKDGVQYSYSDFSGEWYYWTARRVGGTWSNTDPTAAPIVTRLNPQSVVIGSPGFTLTVTGAGFVSGATVRVNGAARPTTFLSATQVTAAVPASDVVSGGTRAITVVSPTAIGGGSSLGVPLSVVFEGQTPLRLAVAIAPAGAVTFTCPAGYTNIGWETYKGTYPDTSTPVTPNTLGPGLVCSAVGAAGYTMEGGYLNGTRTTDDGDYWVRISKDGVQYSYSDFSGEWYYWTAHRSAGVWSEGPSTTGTITVTTNLTEASFNISGPASYTGRGLTFSVANAPFGTYSIAYDRITCFVTPASESRQLFAGQTLSFGPALYLPDRSPACVPGGGVQLTLLHEARENSRVVQASAEAIDVDYRLRIANSGTIAAHHVSIIDTLPRQLTFLSAEYFGGQPSSCSLAAGPPPIAGDSQVVCVIDTLGPGAFAEINLSLRVNGGTAVGPITTNATVSADEVDTDVSDNEMWATIGVIPASNPSIPVPLDTDGEPVDPYLVVNGELNGRVASSRPTIVLTHGMQFAADYSSLSTTLWTFDRDDGQGASSLLPLEHCGQGPSATSPTCINVIQVVWPAAFTVRTLGIDIPDRDEYALARAHAFGAAVQVAGLLRDQLGSTVGYAGDRVQLIGHSLGTVVNAYTASLLLPHITGVETLQFTALDRPDHVGKIKTTDTHDEAASDFGAQFGFHSNFFATALAAGRAGNTTTQIMVDNYYAANSSTDGYGAATSRFRLGVGAVASGSMSIPVYNHAALERPAKVEATVLKSDESSLDNDHTGVHQWYRWSMGPNSSAFVLPSWSATPPPENAIIPGDRSAPYCRGSVFLRPVDPTAFVPALDLSLSPCLAGWGYSILAGNGPPTKAEAPDLVDTSLGEQVDVQVSFDLTNFRNIHGCTLSASYSIVCAEASSAYAQVPIDLPLNTQYLQLRYRFINPGDDDGVTLFLDELPLWSARGSDHRAGEWVMVPTPVRGLAGRRIITVFLEGKSAVNAVVELGEFRAIVGNSAPVVQAGSGRIVEATGADGALATLSPASLSDPDGDPLVVEWTGPFGTAQGSSLSVVLPLGTHRIRLRASDPSGASGDDYVTITVRDSVPPSLSGLPTAPTVEATSASGAAVTWPAPLAVDAVDPSPVLTCAPASGSVFPIGQTLVTCTGTDNSGNAASSSFTATVRDSTAPAISITSPTERTYLLNEAISAGYSCSDNGSGVQRCAGPVPNAGNVNTATLGMNSFVVTANDFAGNSSSKTRSYSVSYAGGGTCLGAPGHQVLQPINADGTSVFKRGSTVPVKFRVCDGTGSSIGTPGVVTDFRLIRTVAGTASLAVNEPVDSTTPDATFRWSAADRQWIFNISTKALSANVTYVYLVTLNDGSTMQFQFGTK